MEYKAAVEKHEQRALRADVECFPGHAEEWKNEKCGRLFIVATFFFFDKHGGKVRKYTSICSFVQKNKNKPRNEWDGCLQGCKEERMEQWEWGNKDQGEWHFSECQRIFSENIVALGGILSFRTQLMFHMHLKKIKITRQEGPQM